MTLHAKKTSGRCITQLANTSIDTTVSLSNSQLTHLEKNTIYIYISQSLFFRRCTYVHRCSNVDAWCHTGGGVESCAALILEGLFRPSVCGRSRRSTTIIIIISSSSSGGDTENGILSDDPITRNLPVPSPAPRKNTKKRSKETDEMKRQESQVRSSNRRRCFR